MIRTTETSRNKFYQLISQYVPGNAVHYCYDLWMGCPFHFKIARRRQTKLGDYRYDPNGKEHSITINYNLNTYNFLITYLHEYAHLLATEKYGRKINPHGKEWQTEFRNVMFPMLSPLIFPDNLLKVLAKHMKRPKASTQSDPMLVKALRNYDSNPTDVLLLDDIQTGEIFAFKGNRFKKLESRRTRVLCHHILSGRKYLIPRIARIEKDV